MFLLVEAVNIINDGSGSSRLRPIPRVTARCSADVCAFPKPPLLTTLTGSFSSVWIAHEQRQPQTQSRDVYFRRTDFAVVLLCNGTQARIRGDRFRPAPAGFDG